jgi:hypothetical protein
VLPRYSSTFVMIICGATATATGTATGSGAINQESARARAHMCLKSVRSRY